jgi:plasmid stabilization system protein ParE
MMSSPEHALIFSSQAQSDYEAILAYSLRRWGEKQAAAYEDVLLRALSHLQDRPLLGRAR